jgi:UDP-glucose 6-dehydrogenase
MNTAITAIGHAGLVGGSCFSNKGANVNDVDKDLRKIAGPGDGMRPTCERDVDANRTRRQAAGNFSFPSGSLPAVAIVSQAPMGPLHHSSVRGPQELIYPQRLDT